VLVKTSVRQAANFAEAGGAAREKTIELELKLIADVGLVGYPNVGKSTFLSVSTSANPKIANYHFTTITPNLCVVQLYDDSFVLADIPGLIEGASEGAGLGLDFLKHIERTRVLIHVIDVSGSEGRDPIDDFEKINAELAGYSEKLAAKPQIVAANKIDMAPDENIDALREYVESRGLRFFTMCAPIHEGVDDVLKATYEELRALPEEEEIIVAYDPVTEDEDPDYREIRTSFDGEKYIVEGKQLKKIFDSTNFNDAGSLRYLYNYMLKRGAIDQLKDLGLEEGDIISVFDYEFEYIEE
jgi:GTP-binding protein